MHDRAKPMTTRCRAHATHRPHLLRGLCSMQTTGPRIPHTTLHTFPSLTAPALPCHCSLPVSESRLTGTSSRLICFEVFHLPPFIAYSGAEGSCGLRWFFTNSSCAHSARWAGGSAPLHFLPFLAPWTTQIHALEMLALISLLQSQGSRLRVLMLIAFVDNQAALVILRKSSCNKASDLPSLATHAHDLCRGLHIELFTYWAPSALHIADGPSRGQPCPLGSPRRLLLHVHQLQTFLTDPALALHRQIIPRCPRSPKRFRSPLDVICLQC